MEMNLVTTLRAYPKISLSILKDYPTRDEMNTVLEGYVTEVPADGKTYARRDEEWVSIRSNRKLIYTGFTDYMGTMTTDLVVCLDRYEVSVDETCITVSHDICKPGVCWFCSSVPINSIKDDTGFLIDYVKQDSVVVLEDEGERVKLFCYRTTTPLVANTWSFTIVL